MGLPERVLVEKLSKMNRQGSFWSSSSVILCFLYFFCSKTSVTLNSRQRSALGRKGIFSISDKLNEDAWPLMPAISLAEERIAEGKKSLLG